MFKNFLYNPYLWLWVALLVLFMKQALDRVSQSYNVKWFRPLICSWRESYDWKDIKEILESDPLDEKFTRSKTRGVEPITVIGDIAIFIFVGSFLVIIGNFMMDTPSEALISKWPGLSESKDIIVAVIALVGALYTAANQLRAKVRSENRQKWIDDVRNTLAKVIKDIPRDDQDKKAKQGGENFARLELLLNPSEKDHRTLSVLLRKAYGMDDMSSDKHVLDKLDIIEDIDSKEQQNKLTTWIIRLSNAMLKREWELVKYGR